MLRSNSNRFTAKAGKFARIVAVYLPIVYRIKASDNPLLAEKSSFMIYIPNLLTLARIGLVPWLVVLLQNQQYGWSLAVFVIAGVSDGLDGFIAKRFNATTYLGSILDPIADKILLVTSYIMLSVLEIIPFWLMVVVVFRDLVIIGGNLPMALFFSTMEMKPLGISKINTVVQILYIVLVLASLSFEFNSLALITVVGMLVAVTSVSSGLAYVYIGSVKATKMSEEGLN